MQVEKFGGKPLRYRLLQNVVLFTACLLLLAQAAQGGAWNRKRGGLGIKLSYFSLSTDRHYSTGGGQESQCLLEKTPGCFRHALDGGVEIPVFSDLQGSARSKALFVTVEYGLLSRVQLMAQMGYFKSENDFTVPVPPSVTTQAEGLSDLWMELKVQYLAAGRWAAAVSGGAKAPTGDFNRNAFGVSLGEGSWDFQVKHEVGVSLWPLPFYANAMAGYRWRGANPARINFGDEWIYELEAGANIGRALLLKISFFGFAARDDQQLLGIGQEFTPGRKVTFFAPTLFWNLAGYVLEMGIEHSVAGRNYLSGTKLNLGMQRNFNLF